MRSMGEVRDSTLRLTYQHSLPLIFPLRGPPLLPLKKREKTRTDSSDDPRAHLSL
jgi:hypothetical protein